MVGFGVLSPREAVAAIDFHTLALLFGMMIVASFSGISYLSFALALAPVAIVGLATASVLLAWIFRRDLDGPTPPEEAETRPAAVDRGLLRKSLIVTVLLLIALVAGLPPS